MQAAASETEARDRAQFTLRMRQRGLANIRVLRALERTPRSFFVPQRYADIAARDIALPIGGGQTAPPPSTVASMIEALRVDPSHRVLEIGAGSGYATALLGQVAAEVVSLERCQSLAVEAAARVAAFGLVNVTVAPCGRPVAGRGRGTLRSCAGARPDRAAGAAADALARARRRAGRGDGR